MNGSGLSMAGILHGRIHRPVWVPLVAPAGYCVEMDVSRPGGAVKHRLLPNGEGREGNVPETVRLDDVVGPSIKIEGENQTDEAREFLDDFDAQVKAIDQPSDQTKDPEGS